MTLTASRDGILHTSYTEDNGEILSKDANDGACHRNGAGFFDAYTLTMNSDGKRN